MNIQNLLNNDVTQEEYLRYKNATLLFRKMPNEINGLVVKKNDINIIILNEYLSEENKRKVFLHELAHIELNQLNQVDNDLFIFKVNKYEDDADLYIKMLLDKIKEIS